jgi:hypothetical protein
MDWAGIISGLISIYLLWQQNQIFKKQNEIFAAQAGAKPMRREVPKRSMLTSRWPLLAMAALVILNAAITGYGYYERSQNDPETLRLVWSRWDYKYISGRDFQDETLPLDGNVYEHCSFRNVKFKYAGSGPYRISDCKFDGEVTLLSASPAVQETMNLVSFLNRVRPGPVVEGISPHLPEIK